MLLCVTPPVLQLGHCDVCYHRIVTLHRLIHLDFPNMFVCFCSMPQHDRRSPDDHIQVYTNNTKSNALSGAFGVSRLLYAS